MLKHCRTANFFTLFLCSAVFYSARAQLIPHGSQQIFKVQNKVTLFDLSAQSKTIEETSYTFSTQLKVNSVWNKDKEQLLQVFFSESRVSAPTKHETQIKEYEITKIPDRPFYISLVDGIPQKVIAHTSRDQSLLNLERGLASLLQLRYENGPVREVDVSGQCYVFYAVKSSTRIEKTKTDCSHWDLLVNYRSEQVLRVAQHSREHVQYELTADGALSKVESLETHTIALAAKPNVGSRLSSEFALEHLETGDASNVPQLNFPTLEAAVESLMEWYRVFDVNADVDGIISELRGTTFKHEVAQAKQLLDEHIGKSTLALNFAQLLPLARITKQSEFVEVLQEHKELHGQLVDLLGAVQTIEAHNAIEEVFKYNENNDAELLEKYLQSLAVGTHPDRAIIKQLLEVVTRKESPVQNEKLRDSIVQSVAALTRESSLGTDDPLRQELLQLLLTNLQEHCKDAECKTLYIRALQNLQDVSTLSTLLRFAMAGEPKVSVAALEALKSFPLNMFSESHRQLFAQIFYQRQRKFDSSARILALDILLSLKPTKQQLGQLLDYLNSNDRHFEIKTYVIQKLHMLGEKCPRFNALLTACLEERPEINNYHVIAQKGLTTVLMRQLSQSPAYNETLLSVQEIYQGVLKRGSVELLLGAGGEETTTFKLGIYTSGLSSFVGDDNEAVDDEADDNPATAGMEIEVQGVLLRPLVFFTGQGELMGHVWSGTATEPTPAYQATTLAQDHEHYIILSSGATLYSRVIGTRSVDLNGKIELSLWNRNAQTEIQQNSGAAVVGHVAVGFTYAKLTNDFTLTHEPKIILQADVDFYSGIRLCMQLQRPELEMTHSIIKSVFLQSDSKKFTKRVRKSVNHRSPGRTLALNQKNNEMCNIIFNDV